MLTRPRMALLAGAALALAFLWGIAHLFVLRFEAGDVYPLYSTLRPDPLGSKALHDALAAMPEIQVERSYRPLEKLRAAPDTTIWMLGAGERFLGTTMDLAFWSDMASISTPHLQTLLAQGGRLVFTLLPSSQWGESAAAAQKRREEQEKRSGAKDAASKDGTKKADEEKKPVESMKERWGVGLGRFERGDGGQDVGAPATAQPGTPVEPEISWHTTMHFTELDPAWRVIYEVRGEPVLIERRVGLGSIVLSTDSFFAGNEALRTERSPRLLAWLQGGSRRALFDEEHLGVTENPGIATLARRYNLHGAVAGLVLLAALFVWKNMASFVPPHAASRAGADTVVSTRTASAGLVNLLRRSIPGSDILSVCWLEWRKTFAHREGGIAGQLARAEQIVAETGAKRPVDGYRQISALFSKHS